MPAACRPAPCAPPDHDPERALVQAYTRLILLPARGDGLKETVIARVGAQDVRLVEELPVDEPPEQARLRVEVYDRTCDSTVASVACEDLQEAEAATVALLAEAARKARRPAQPGMTRTEPVLALRPIPVATGCADEAGFLVLADGRLAAVLVQLSGELHGAAAAGSWFVEAGFGPCQPAGERVFATLGAAERWLKACLAGKGVSDGQR